MTWSCMRMAKIMVTGLRSKATLLFEPAGADGSDTLAFVGAVVATVDLSGATDQTIGDNSDVSGFENVDGSRATAALNLTGSSGANVLKGGSAGDTFVGFVGADTIDGGGGTDTLALGGTSTDLNSATDGQLVNVENITTSAAATINLSNQSDGFTITGSSGADTITGSSGNDTIDGGLGTGTISGGGGDDRIRYYNIASLTLDGGANGAAGDTLVMNGSTGATVNLGSVDQTTGDNTIVNNFENVDASGATSAVNLTGSSGANVLEGGSAADTFVGLVGADTIDGGGGTDTLTLSGTSVDLNSATNAQLVSVENITISAAATVNLSNQTEGFTITGSSGADTITGGAGNDTITGGAAVDTFNVASGNDTITDLGNGGADILVVSSGATASATATAAWAATASTSNAGTASINANGFSVSVAAATGANGGTLTNGSTTAVTMTGSANADHITSATAGDTINAGAGSDTVTINAGTTARTWAVDLGSDAVADKVVFSHATLGVGDNTVATVSNFNVANDSVAVVLNGANIADGSFQAITATGTNVSAGVEVISLFYNAGVSASLTEIQMEGPSRTSLPPRLITSPWGTTRSSFTQILPALLMLASTR